MRAWPKLVIWICSIFNFISESFAASETFRFNKVSTLPGDEITQIVAESAVFSVCVIKEDSSAKAVVLMIRPEQSIRARDKRTSV